MFIKVNIDTSCTDEEKIKLLPLIERITKVSEIAREKGLLSIPETYDEIENPTLISALEFAVMGINPAEITENFNYLLLSDAFSPVQLLERYLIYEGVLRIQCSLNRKDFKLLLLSMLGEKWVYDELFFQK